MPRRARIVFPGFPHHLTQRGHRGQAVFFGEHDRRDYLETLRECREAFGMKLYAWCLMTNHVHLVVDPGERPEHISLLMKRLAGRHSRRLNRLHGWKGALWEGRFRCSPIDTDRYLLACGRYVDQNPVRARLVERIGDYPWSSYRARAGFEECEWLDVDPALADLARTAEERFEVYRRLAAEPLPQEDLDMIRGASKRNQLTGSDDFVNTVRAEFGVNVPARKPGRPRKLSRVSAAHPASDVLDFDGAAEK